MMTHLLLVCQGHCTTLQQECVLEGHFLQTFEPPSDGEVPERGGTCRVVTSYLSIAVSHSPCAELHLEKQQVLRLCEGPQLGHPLGGFPIANARVVQPPRHQHVRVNSIGLDVINRRIRLHVLVILEFVRVPPPSLRGKCVIMLPNWGFNRKTYSSYSMTVRGIVSSSMVVRQSTKGT